jgi:hypothetical protein
MQHLQYVELSSLRDNRSISDAAPVLHSSTYATYVDKQCAAAAVMRVLSNSVALPLGFTVRVYM